MKFSINLIQSHLEDRLPTPEKLEEIFTFRLCEVEGLESLPNGDTLIDLNILPNRAHDMLGHYGVARELAGQLGLALKPLEIPGYIVSDTVLPVKVAIEAEKCKRYMSRQIDGVSIGTSPEWLVEALVGLGQRSINNVVDMTNYVLWQTGQPTHVFDADKLTGGITVRPAKAGEHIVLLDGKDLELDESVMVIADDVAVLAIAGIKGGKHAEVDSSTKNIVLEVANFDASTIRKTAQKLGLRTDASYRFERDISPEMCKDSLDLLTGLIVEHCGLGQLVGAIADTYPVPQAITVIEFSLAEVVRVAGSSISNADVTNILQRYGFPYIEREDNFSVTVPLWRLDLAGRHDMIEEIIRIRGLEYIDPVAPVVLDTSENKMHNLIQYIRSYLLEKGFSEVMTYSFRDTGESRVLASAGDKSCLRANLHEGFQDSLIRNYRNRDLFGLDSLEQFEIGTVFGVDSEFIHLCIGVHKAKQKGVSDILWKDLSDMFYDLGITERAIHECITYKNEFVIECNLSQIVQPVTNKTKMDEITSRTGPQNKFGVTDKVQPFIEWSKYPFITRDIAVWVPESYNSKELETLYIELGGELLVRAPRLVDQFSKEGRTSYAYRLVFQSSDRTLADEDIAPITDAMYSRLKEGGFEVR